MKTIKSFAAALLLAGAVLSTSCTDLDEKFYGELERTDAGGAAVDPQNLLTSAYKSMNNRMGHWHFRVVHASTDEFYIPNQGWDFQSLHLHEPSASNWLINNVFGELTTTQFAAANVMRAPGATPQQVAEARFIRALTMQDFLGLWGFLIQRENMDDFSILPIVQQPAEAIAFLQQEIEAAIPDLPTFDKTQAWVASKEAAKMLYMKLLLNKAVFLDRANPNPAHQKADMDKVLALAAEIKTAAPSLKLAEGKAYYDNFAPLNDQISDENIFTLYNQPGDRMGGLANSILFPTFSNMKPSGYEGGVMMVTTGKFYDLFEAGDVRRGTNYNGYAGDTLSNPGLRVNVGFLIGQQYDLSVDTPLVMPNSTLPMVFTKNIRQNPEGDGMRMEGIRVNKYPYDFQGTLTEMRNDWAVFRFADLRLMEAEAILRGGGTASATDALAIVNELRTKRGAPLFTSVTLKDEDLANGKGSLISERGRELYWEGWRREDIIRFGTFRDPGEVKVKESHPHTLVWPVPTSQLSPNPNLKQNPGY